MAIGTSAIIVLLLSSVMIINFQSSKQDMLQNLYEMSINNISSISGKLAQTGGDEASIESTINAEFDNGYYKMIEFKSSDGNFTYKQIDNEDIEGVPSWFIKLSDIKLDTITVDVSSGWSIIGRLSVQGDASNIYKGLYKIFIQLLYLFVVFVSISLISLSILLHFILKPLKKIQKQAKSIAKDKFIIQKNIPKTKELKDVVESMNKMILKIKTMFDKANMELKKQKELEYTDATTKLKNRKYLIDKLPEFLKIDASSEGGINMMIALSGVIQANEKIGHRDVDKLFLELANLFKEQTNSFKNSIVARMNGTEFAIFLPGCSSDKALSIAKKINQDSKMIITNYKLNSEITFISIGLYEYNHKQTIAQLLSLSDNALTKAKFDNSHIHLDKAENAVKIMGKDAWRDIINEALTHNNFSFVSWNVVDAKTKKVVHSVLSIVMKTKDSKSYSYGQFMASAIQVGLSSKIYQNIINILFKNQDLNLKNSIYSLRLSYEYLNTKESYNELVQLCSNYASALNFKLIIEMPDKLVRQNSELVKLYKKLFEKYNIEMGIFEFIGESNDYYYLQDLRPAYIKAEATFFISKSTQSLSALRLITDSVGITLIATSVMDKQTLEKLQKKDIHTIQGRVTELILS
jgi:diguanylate cyclase (GGDEF)-like protein